ncbi:MAG: hypothetical protein WA441_08545 [Methyloceanibacter sp.]|jgi:hypothetical protein
MSAVRTLLAILAAGLGVGACAAPMATIERTVMGDPAKPYFGMTKAEIIACAGRPSGSYTHGTGETLTYHYSGAGPVPSPEKEKSDEPKGPLGPPKSDKNYECNASMVFDADHLIRVTFAPREAISPYKEKKDPKTGEMVYVTPPKPCVFSLPNCARR